jgi:hypothetical protein
MEARAYIKENKRRSQAPKSKKKRIMPVASIISLQAAIVKRQHFSDASAVGKKPRSHFSYTTIYSYIVSVPVIKEKRIFEAAKARGALRSAALYIRNIKLERRALYVTSKPCHIVGKYLLPSVCELLGATALHVDFTSRPSSAV